MIVGGHYVARLVIAVYLSGVLLPLTDSKSAAAVLLMHVMLWALSLTISGPANDFRRFITWKVTRVQDDEDDRASAASSASSLAASRGW
jgi:polynucleotide 5'-kinase involved in rRNA processing